MGADFYAQACIGVRIPYGETFTRRRVRAYEHCHPVDWECDPRTGRKLWKYEDASVFDGKLPAGVSVLEGGSSEDIDYVYVTRVSTKSVNIGYGSDSETPSSLENVSVEKEREALRNVLEPLGLWKPEQFGLWIVPHLSV